MMPLTLAQIADVVGGDLPPGAAGDRVVTDVTIDSRAVEAGSLFVPLRGERSDGHEFVADAVARGATGYLWEDRRPSPQLPGTVLVDHAGDALLGLGAWVRDNVDPVVVAITGSSGKTTTKDLVAAAVSSSKVTVANHGSYNNEIGVPLTCCRLTADSEVLVAEVGSRGLGHIAQLAPILSPDIAVVTAVGASHLALLGDVATVALAKRELVEALDSDGTAVLNADDPRVAAMAEFAPGRVVTYGTTAGADWRGEGVALDELARPAFTVRGKHVRLPLPGMHNVSNALAALAVADLVGVDLHRAVAALEVATVSPWRMELVHGRDGTVVLNDAYNANPLSMTAALDALAGMVTSGRRWAVLGHMAELGPGSAEAHQAIGRHAARVGVDGLVVVGDEATGIAEGAREVGDYTDDTLQAVGDPAAAATLLRRLVHGGDVVLVKASRSVGLEGVADALVGGNR